MNCSNCEGEASSLNSLAVYPPNKPDPIVLICEKCQVEVITLKIVLARKDTKHVFAFEGYLPVATERKVK